jgi:hypothetical protein
MLLKCGQVSMSANYNPQVRRNTLFLECKITANNTIITPVEKLSNSIPQQRTCALLLFI